MDIFKWLFVRGLDGLGLILITGGIGFLGTRFLWNNYEGDDRQ